MPSALQLALDLPAMARLVLSDEERDELVRALREMIDGDRFPLSQRVRRLKAILDKLDPSPARPKPSPTPKPIWRTRSRSRAARQLALIE